METASDIFHFKLIVYPMLPVSMDCPFFFIAPAVFSNVHLIIVSLNIKIC